MLIDVNFVSETSDKATATFLEVLKGRHLNTTRSSRSCQLLPLPDIQGGAECLGLTPKLSPENLSYPVDAEEHFFEIEMALARWKQKGVHRPHRAAGYGGPWIENIWIRHFEDKMFGAAARASGPPPCLRSVFGPFVPILLPWVDRWIGNGKSYPQGMLAALTSVLRKDVLYVTLAQNDVGLDGAVALSAVPNLLVLSAGGFGHVPVPLLKQVEPLLSKRPVGKRAMLVSFTGSLGHSPGRMRGHMQQVARHFVSSHSPATNITMYEGANWREVMAESRGQLCPRGYGRSSYHISESVQMGLVPIHVYLDVPWVPYADTVFKELGYAVDLKVLESLLVRLAGQSGSLTEAEAVAELEAKEAAAERYRLSHFTYEGAMAQIGRFLLRPSASVPSGSRSAGAFRRGLSTAAAGSDLRCTAIPESPRAAAFPEPVWANSLSGAHG